MSKVISIIIATYNSENVIDECLASIVKQYNKKIEIIIVDGLSNDSTLKKSNKYNDYISLIISEADEGIYDAWNKGIKVSTGNWIMFLGSDDRLYPGALDKYLHLVEKINFREIDYISARNNLADGHWNTIKIIGKKYEWNKFRHYMNVAHVGSLHSKRLFTNYGLYDISYKICGDYELLLRPHNNLNAIFLDDIIAEMRVGGVSYNSTKALAETLMAKKKNRVNNLIIIYFDHLYAITKNVIKKLLNYK